MKREQLEQDLQELMGIMDSLPYGTEIWNTAREAVESTKKALDEMDLWADLEALGFIPTEVEILPECATFDSFDHHGNELWNGVSGKQYMVCRV